MTPTRLYVPSCLAAIRDDRRGEGARAHHRRRLPRQHSARVAEVARRPHLDLSQVDVLPVFKWMAQTGDIAEQEMLRTFNCGIGMIAIVAPGDVKAVMATLTEHGESVVQLGEVVPAQGDERVTYERHARSCADNAAMARKRIAILISGRGSNMSALIDAAKDPNYPAEIVLVVSNRPDAGGLQPPPPRTASRRQWSITRLTARIGKASNRRCKRRWRQHRIDIVCLAGFMRLLTGSFVSRWTNRMLNIHPALLPAFKGLDNASPRHRGTGGASWRDRHFVVPEMDPGPIIAQGAVPVLPDDTEDTLSKRVLARSSIASIRSPSTSSPPAACVSKAIIA